jgi:hypothetical protein
LFPRPTPFQRILSPLPIFASIITGPHVEVGTTSRWRERVRVVTLVGHWVLEIQRVDELKIRQLEEEEESKIRQVEEEPCRRWVEEELETLSHR